MLKCLRSWERRKTRCSPTDEFTELIDEPGYYTGGLVLDDVDPTLSRAHYNEDEEWWARFHRATEELSRVLEERGDEFHLELKVDSLGSISYELRTEGRVARNWK